MADVEANVDIRVEGAGSLASAAAEAEALKEALKGDRDAAAETSAAMESMKVSAAGAGSSLGDVRDGAKEAAAAQADLKRAVDSYRDSAGRLRHNGSFIKESDLRDLIQAGEAAEKVDKSLGGGGSGRSGLSRIARDSEDAEKGLRDVGKAAGDAEQAIGDGGAIGSGLTSAVGDLGGSFGKLQSLGMPALIVGIASAASTIGPALLATGAGVGAWGALAAPAVIKVKDALTSVSAAQQKYDAASALAKADPTTANVKAQAKALTALHNAYAVLPPDVAKSVTAIQGVEKAFSKASKPIQRQAEKDLPKLADDVKGLIPDLSKLAGAGGGVVSSLITGFGKFEKSSGFKSFISNVTSEVPGAVGPLRNLGGALGSVVTALFSKGNVATGDKFLNSLAALTKAYGPKAVKGLNDTATAITKINNALAKSTKPGGDENNAEKFLKGVAASAPVAPYAGALKAINRGGKAIQKPTNPLTEVNSTLARWFYDATGMYVTGQGFAAPKGPTPGQEIINNAKQHASQLMSWNNTAGKAIADFFTPHIGGGGVSWNYSNLKPPVPTRTIAASQQQGARALLQGGTAGKAGFGNQQITEKVKVKADTSGAKSELAQLSHYKMQDAKIKVTVTGADTAKTAFQGVVTAAQQAGTKAGTAIGTGIQAGRGKATSAATAVAGGVKGAVAPLPGQLQAIGASAGAGMAAGISSETGAVSAAAAGLAAAAAKAARVKLNSHSPSKVFQEIGTSTWQGYVLGLEGGQSQVDAATKALVGTLPFKDSAITSTVKQLRKEIDLAAKDQKINPLEKMGLTQLLDQDNQKLMSLAKQRAKLVSQIQAADALAKSVQQSAMQGADLGTLAASTTAGQADAADNGSLDFALGGTQVGSSQNGTLAQGLQSQLSSIQKFDRQLKQLKKEGLDKAGLKELANDGVQAGSEAASQILAGGQKGVKAIAQLDNSIGLASKKLGVTAGNAAYEGASQIGGQLAAGLKDSLKAVDKQMAALDKSLIVALMTGLGDSPKAIKAALAKVDKELGLSSGSSGGSSGGGKITPPHEIYHPKPTQGRFAQPGPIGTPPHVVTPAFGGAAASAGGPIVITLNSTIAVSGRTLAKVVQTKTLQRASSNVSSGLTLPGRTS